MGKSCRSLVIALAALTGVLSLACGSQGSGSVNSAGNEPPAKSSPGTQIYQAVGVVKGMDWKAKEVTIDHEDIPGYMSAMQMTFAIKDPKMLKGIFPGDKVDFELERRGEDLTVTKILLQGAAQLSEGERTFRFNCAGCHGLHGQGTKKGISFLKGHALHHSRDDFIDQVVEGEKDKMPSFKDKLSEDQIEQVVDYVRNVIQKDAKKGDSESGDN